MLLDPRDWSLASRSDEVIAGLEPELRDRVTPETHAAVMEVTTGVHRRVADATAELAELRWKLSRALAGHGLRAGVAGMHPTAVGSDTVVSSHPRYRAIGASMRVLARREPTLATHVHVGIADPRAAVRLLNRLRVHLPLLLALSANSPFWQGRATGFASTRTTVFDAFPRTGVARAFRDYADWVERVDALLRSGAIADPSLLWWDARLQPRYGTVEVRIMDAQTTVADVGAVAALVQSLALLELERPDRPGDGPPVNELVEENRFLAARDGMQALLIDALRQAHRRRRSARRRPRRLPPLGGRARLRARAGDGPSPRGGQRRIAPGGAAPTAATCEPSPRAWPAPMSPMCRCRPTRPSARPGGRPSVRPHPSGRRRRRTRRPSRTRRR